jgi:hypothetical protein
VVSDGWGPYRSATAGLYVHRPLVGSGAAGSKLLPRVHRVAALAKRWMLSTHQGAIGSDHLAFYLNEFVFRFNRRRSRSRGLVFYRVLELAILHEPVRYGDLIAPAQAWSRALSTASNVPISTFLGAAPRRPALAVGSSDLLRLSG